MQRLHLSPTPVDDAILFAKVDCLRVGVAGEALALVAGELIFAGDGDPLNTDARLATPPFPTCFNASLTRCSELV